ncbi:response regulator transcription factor [Sediminispirochaeta bajacaliforniensis]|uniref:response regulator transcription factor n=1 Tax=Sediminispirochaeta bajacaliforniensis TaxID=148 RepID=UPI000382D9E4|nr:response regulator transcription factor [Sediminispirochaeta bajacaliforniensis]
MDEHTQRILVVDDEKELAKMICDYLSAMGFITESASDGSRALRLIGEKEWDLLVLDVMMPGLDGFDVARKVRADRGLPIIFLTARAEESDRILGFEIGGDDYVTKPFSMKELAARIRAVLRRSASGEKEPEADTEIVRGSLRLNPVSMKVRLGNDPVALTPGQFAILKQLVSYPDRVFTRNELLQEVSGDYTGVYERTIDVHIKNIRKAIENDPSRPRYIETIHGIGYRFTVPPGEGDE